MGCLSDPVLRRATHDGQERHLEAPDVGGEGDGGGGWAVGAERSPQELVMVGDMHAPRADVDGRAGVACAEFGVRWECRTGLWRVEVGRYQGGRVRLGRALVDDGEGA